MEYNYYCTNGCYFYEFAYGTHVVCIFNHYFYAYYTFNRIQWEEYNKNIQKEIQYWKENDRYLLKLMGIE